MTDEHLPPAPLWRRLAAMAYDSILILAIWMVVAFVVLSLFGIENARTLEGETVTLDPLYKNVLFGAMLFSAWAFFGWFWTHSGQTLGMQAWRLKVVTAEDAPSHSSTLYCASFWQYLHCLFSVLGFSICSLTQSEKQSTANCPAQK